MRDILAIYQSVRKAFCRARLATSRKSSLPLANSSIVCRTVIFRRSVCRGTSWACDLHRNPASLLNISRNKTDAGKRLSSVELY